MSSMQKGERKTKRKDQLSGLEYMSWPLNYEPSCMMNQTGSSSLSFCFLTLQSHSISHLTFKAGERHLKMVRGHRII